MGLSTRTYALAASAVAAVSIVAIALVPALRGNDPFAECRTSVVAGGQATIGGPFSLLDENGNRVTDHDVLKGPALVYFGYTYCPDICPADMARTAEATDLLEAMGHIVTPVLITVDPARDTPEVLKEWTDYLHPRMIGLTGSEEEIAAAAKAYRTFYRTPSHAEGEDYVVDHMTHTYLMLPELGFVEFFRRDLSAEDLARGVACFLDAAG